MLNEFILSSRSRAKRVLKLVPISIALGVVFAVLTQWSACNPGQPVVAQARDRHRHPVLVPDPARRALRAHRPDGDGRGAYLRHPRRRCADGVLDNGFGPLAEMPLWAQALTFLVASDFLLYWFHRLYHGAAMWKYHAVHHSSEELDWISAARFHPVNILLGTRAGRCRAAAGRHLAQRDAVGRAVHHRDLRLRARQSELDLRPVQIRAGGPGVPPLAPHDADRGGNKNFAGTFPIWTSCSAPFTCRRMNCRTPMASTKANFRKASAARCSIRSSNERCKAAASGRRRSLFTSFFALHSPICSQLKRSRHRRRYGGAGFVA